MLKALNAINSLSLWMICATPGHEQGMEHFGWYELGIPWAQASKCYKKLKAMDDMNDSVSWAQGSG